MKYQVTTAAGLQHVEESDLHYSEFCKKFSETTEVIPLVEQVAETPTEVEETIEKPKKVGRKKVTTDASEE